MKSFLTAAARAIMGVWLWMLLIGLFWAGKSEPIVDYYESCCWVMDQFNRRYYIGPEPRTILGIPISEEK